MNWKALKQVSKEMFLYLIASIGLGAIFGGIIIGIHLVTGCGPLVCIALILFVIVISFMCLHYIELDQRSKE